jgi:N-carbamoylputrescine amidase
MKICTAEFPDEQNLYAKAMEEIEQHVSETNPDMLVLPEMPFAPWVFHADTYNEETWQHTVENHAHWLSQLSNAIPTPIITSRPITRVGKNLNEAFYMDHNRNIHSLRSKRYLPNDFPALERVWFHEGESSDAVFDIQGNKFGMQLCSEIMYTETPRKLAENDVEIIVQARATGDHPRWRAASLLAASTAGAYVVGANRRSVERDWFTGGSWVYSPEGELLAETSAAVPFVTVELDLSRATNARAEYPVTMYKHYNKMGS